MTSDKESKVPKQLRDALDALSRQLNKVEYASGRPTRTIDVPIPDNFHCIDYLDHISTTTPMSRESAKELWDSIREIAKDVKFEKPIPVDAKVPERWDALLDLPPQACNHVSMFNVGKSRTPVDLSLIVSKARHDVGGFGYGKSFRMRALVQHLENGGETSMTTLELSKDHEFWFDRLRCDFGTGKTLLQFAHDEARVRGRLVPEMSWDLYRDTVITHEVKFREPDLPRIYAASVVADVQGSIEPDNDERRLSKKIARFSQRYGGALS